MKPLVTDALWERLQPLLPPHPPRRFRFPGRKPLDDRMILTVFSSYSKPESPGTSCPPNSAVAAAKRVGIICDSGTKRVWLKLHALLLAELNGANQIDWERALIDASFAKAPEGGEKTGPNPTDRSKSRSKHHVLTDAQGIPLNVTLTAANVNEVTEVLHVLTTMPPVGGKPGPDRQRPERLQGDRGYDSEPLRDILRWLRITPVIAARNTEHGSGLGVTRWFVERTNSWLHAFGRLRRRLDRLADVQEAFLRLASAVICLRFLS
jgi:transposase